jgi:putative transposase
MKKTRFTESQIVVMLKEYEGGKNVDLICRDAGVSRATFYKWKSKCSGLEVNELQRIDEQTHGTTNESNESTACLI